LVCTPNPFDRAVIEEQARVVQAEGDFVEIVTEKRSACGSCSARAGCGTSLLSTWFPQRRLSFRLRNDVAAERGDLVVVGLDEGQLQRGAMLLYALPLAGLLIGAVAGEHGFPIVGLPSELGAVLVGLLGLSAALILVRHLSAGQKLGGDRGVRLLRIARPSSIFAAGEIAMPRRNQTEGFRTYE
jgi:sigma-E factor negative regulatory protein RseC